MEAKNMQIYPIKSSGSPENSNREAKQARRTDALRVALLDLNHTTKGLHTCTMPLGIGLLASYLLENLPKGIHRGAVV